MGFFCGTCLEENEQILITSVTGERSVQNGPGLVLYSPLSSTATRGAIVLESGRYSVILNDKHGTKRAVHGPHVEWMNERETLLDEGHCTNVTQQEYLIVTDTTTGKQWTVQGPTMYEPGPYETVMGPMPVYNLSRNQYMRIKDETGRMRIERGEKRVVPSPYDQVIAMHGEMDGQLVQEAVNVDDHTAVLVRNEDTGSLVLHTEHGLFFPGPYQEIVSIETKIILEEYQSMVYKDRTGKFHYVRGDSDMRDFFLPPFCEIVTQQWSTDLRKEHTECETISRFDRRPSYMNYEFNCRTVDNVELIVDVSFFWAIIDVQMLVQKTSDAPGDTCTHARSSIIQEVSKIKLMDFLESFNDIIRKACVGDPFYMERGVDLISVEVLRFSCASQETDTILQDIIKETADRLKNKERQRGENEVALSRLGGEIEEERLKKELIELKKSHLKTEARIEGEAEAFKLVAFMEGVAGVDVGSLNAEQAMQMYLTLRKLDSVQALSNGATQLYLTPADVNLSVGQMFPVQRA